MSHSYSVTIHHLYCSPGHNYFTHQPAAPGNHPTFDVEAVEIHAHQGIVGDRFYGRGPTFDGHVTFFAWEVAQALLDHFALDATALHALRRNVLIAGVPLNQLIGQPFSIEGLHFHGTKHCAPCRWMNLGVAEGALAFLKGRGGLRAKVLSSGYLQRGTAILQTPAPLDLTTITTPLPRPRLP